MARSAAEIETIIDGVLAHVGERVTVVAAFLFGSYAQGEPDDYSDIDIAIFSPEFATWSVGERIDLAANIRLSLYSDVEIHLYSSAALETARKSNFFGHLIETGKKIA